MISELYDEGIKAKLTIGITPILAEQLNDEHLKQGFIDYLDSRIKAVSGDLERYPDPEVAHSQHLKYLAKYYYDWFNHIKDLFINKFNKDLIAGFKNIKTLNALKLQHQVPHMVSHRFLQLILT